MLVTFFLLYCCFSFCLSSSLFSLFLSFFFLSLFLSVCLSFFLSFCLSFLLSSYLSFLLFLLFLLCSLFSSSFYYRSGVLRTQKLSPSPAAAPRPHHHPTPAENQEVLTVLSVKPGADLHMTLRASPSSRNSKLLIFIFLRHSALLFCIISSTFSCGKCGCLSFLCGPAE